jgi:hypothetical protein
VVAESRRTLCPIGWVSSEQNDEPKTRVDERRYLPMGEGDDDDAWMDIVYEEDTLIYGCRRACHNFTCPMYNCPLIYPWYQMIINASDANDPDVWQMPFWWATS